MRFSDLAAVFLFPFISPYRQLMMIWFRAKTKLAALIIDTVGLSFLKPHTLFSHT